MLTYYPQLNNLPFCNRSLPRKTLCMQTTTLLSHVRPPKHHSDLLANFKQIWQRISIFQVFCAEWWTERKKDALLFPKGPTGQFRDCVADAEEFQSLSGHRIYHSPENLSTGQSPRKKKKTLDFILLFMNLFFIYHHLPNLRMKSWFLPFSFRKWCQFLFLMVHGWCQKIHNKKSLRSWDGGENTSTISI